jgi:hypothetical protein
VGHCRGMRLVEAFLWPTPYNRPIELAFERALASEGEGAFSATCPDMPDLLPLSSRRAGVVCPGFLAGTECVSGSHIAEIVDTSKLEST